MSTELGNLLWQGVWLQESGGDRGAGSHAQVCVDEQVPRPDNWHSHWAVKEEPALPALCCLQYVPVPAL